MRELSVQNQGNETDGEGKGNLRLRKKGKRGSRQIATKRKLKEKKEWGTKAFERTKEEGK